MLDVMKRVRKVELIPNRFARVWFCDSNMIAAAADRIRVVCLRVERHGGVQTGNEGARTSLNCL